MTQAMKLKRRNYIAQWRKFKHLSAVELADLLAEFADMHGVQIPVTKASISRIEGGTQNFSVDLLYAIAEVLKTGEDDPTAGDLLSRNPFRGVLEVESFVQALNDRDQRKALGVLRSVFTDEQEEFRQEKPASFTP